MHEFMDQGQIKAFEETMQLVKEMCPGLKVKWDHKLVRGLDYYNGTCFEFKLDKEQPNESLKGMESEIFGLSQNTILAGGRYDYLAS